jgi:undecaprenyl-diphosphatase
VPVRADQPVQALGPIAATVAVAPAGAAEGVDDASTPSLSAAAIPSGVRRRTGRVLTALVGLAAGWAAWRLRGTLGDAASALADLGPWALAAVAACWAGMVASRAAVYRLAHPRSTMGQGLVLDQVNLATTNGVPGGMVVGYAARYRVGRSFGQTPDGITLTMFAAGQAFSLGRWVLVAVVVGHAVLTGGGTEVDTVVLAAALAVLATGVLAWLVVSHDTRVSRWVVTRGQAGLDRLGRRVGRARDVPLVPFVDGVRHGARWLLRERAVALLVTGAAAGLAGALIVVAVVHGLDGPAAPGTWELLRAYLLARVASAFVPTPGNVGALEGALTAGLVAAGVDPASAVAAVLVYRGLTFALPIATGSAAYLGWRRWERHQPD